jgi:ribonuclease HII
MNRKSIKYIIGIDEVGRGPLAGPVVVAAVSASPMLFTKSDFVNLKDSKKLSAKKREEWYTFLKNHPKILWAVARVWPKTIDRVNIARAANLGVRRVYAKLCGKLSFQQGKLSLPQIHVTLDGGLYLQRHIPHETIIKGDEKIPVIAAASIIAKVTRDRIMLRLHKKYPQYRFDLHKGYGTLLHRKLLKQIGRSEIHRQSFRIS